MIYRIIKLGSKNNGRDSVGYHQIQRLEGGRWTHVDGSSCRTLEQAELHLAQIAAGELTDDEVVKEVEI